jgi:hypothetical protein
VDVRARREQGLRGRQPWDHLARTDPGAPKLATLVTCRFCAGVWISAGVVLARRYAPRYWRPISEVLTASAAAVLVANLEDDP